MKRKTHPSFQNSTVSTTVIFHAPESISNQDFSTINETCVDANYCRPWTDFFLEIIIKFRKIFAKHAGKASVIKADSPPKKLS